MPTNKKAPLAGLLSAFQRAIGTAPAVKKPALKPVKKAVKPVAKAVKPVAKVVKKLAKKAVPTKVIKKHPIRRTSSPATSSIQQKKLLSGEDRGGGLKKVARLISTTRPHLTSPEMGVGKEKNDQRGRKPDKTTSKTIQAPTNHHTPPQQKNHTPLPTPIAGDLPKAYIPGDIEDGISALWEHAELGKATGKSKKNAYTMMLPPPNVTGTLHLGHAMTVAIEDIMSRHARMQGRDVLYLPGTDHAGIATQVVVERELAKEGKNRHDMGREAFVERVWEWKHQSHATITKQVKKLGGSLDWSRERFTLDKDYEKAVSTAFEKLYKKGLIYRDKRLVNWSPALQSVVSDLEVVHKEEEGNLYFIRYFVNATDRSICVATTRPETMLGDTAVAVHPDDTRYHEFIGKELILPISNRLIKVIADKRIDPTFGTGAVKITPAHDPLDAEIAKTHKLESIVVIGPHGRMTKHAGKFRGMTITEARGAIIRYLDDIGNLEKITKHLHNVAYCERTGCRIEPLESMQWFVKMQPLAKLAMEAVQKKQVEFIPQRFETEFLRWMENIQDWCISRQLWWGHQIPIWYKKKVQKFKKYDKYPEILVSDTDPGLSKEYAGAAYEREQDVLDTWFSSALWPFATLGWPKKTQDLEHFFPNTILETGRDILFFWVSRMITMSLALMGQVPFPTVYLHGLVVDEEGKKMSKSKGNGIDPLDMIATYGTDALRLALITGSTPGTDTRFGESKITGKRNFVNKLWNASRFVITNLKKKGVPENPIARTLQDKWILSRLNSLIVETDAAFTKYAFSEAAQKIEDFIWKDFCDWYLELSKENKNEGVLAFVLAQTLKLLHPFAPFVTEHIWQQLQMPAGKGAKTKLLAKEKWPTANKAKIQPKIEDEMQSMLTVISAIRSIRTEYAVEPSKLITAIVYAGTHEAALKAHAGEIKKLARLSSLTVKKSGQKVEQAIAKLEAGFEVYLPIAKLIDPKQEKKRLQEEQDECEQYKALIERKLSNKEFMARAPAEVVAGEQQKLAETEEKLRKIRERLGLLK